VYNTGKGFAFVTFDREEDSQTAMREMDGNSMFGKQIKARVVVWIQNVFCWIRMEFRIRLLKMGAFCDPGIRDGVKIHDPGYGSGMNSLDHISESLETIYIYLFLPERKLPILSLRRLYSNTS
jgi:hypothetical protein